MAPQRQKNPNPPPVLANGHDKPDDDPDAGIVVDDPAAETIETEAKVPVVDPGVESLQAQLAAANRRSEAAEAENARLAKERSKDHEVIADSRLLVIDSTIKTNETKRDSILKRMKEAKEAGDYDAEVAATNELSQVNIDLKQAALGKDQLERSIEEAKNAPKAPETEAERFEYWAEQNKIAPQSKAWLKGHMDYVRDPLKNAELMLAHQKALKAGTEPNSDEYFAAVERELGLGANDDTPEEKPERRQAAPSAPVSRSAADVNGGGRKVSPIPGITDLGGGKYRVSKDIAEAAAMAGIPVKKYVEEALKLERGSDGQLH